MLDAAGYQHFTSGRRWRRFSFSPLSSNRHVSEASIGSILWGRLGWIRRVLQPSARFLACQTIGAGLHVAPSGTGGRLDLEIHGAAVLINESVRVGGLSGLSNGCPRSAQPLCYSRTR